MLGKTFKGLSDEQFRAMTERLLALKTAESHGVVRFAPRSSSRLRTMIYSAARITTPGWRCDLRASCASATTRSPEQADSIDTVTADYERQTIRPLADKV